MIFITPSEAHELENQAFQTGAAGFLRKPFTDQALVDLIHRAIAETA